MTSSRQYHSPLRSERAHETRSMILRAARGLFETHGFTATTINQIADEAAVSAPTIYATFGSKGALVVELLDQLEADAAAATDGNGPPANPDEALLVWIESHTRIFDEGRSLLRVIREALGEPAVVELAAEGDRHRRRALVDVLGRLAEGGRLRPGLDVEEATDQAWALSSTWVFLDLVDRCGWTTSQYREWLHDGIRRLLLRP